MSEKTKMTRRRFLILAGGAAGAAALACCGLTSLAARQPAVEMVESSCGEENVENKVLIAYASQCGSTAEVAQTIGQTLCATGVAVDVRQVKDVTDVSGYRAVILGSAVYMNRLMPETVEFVKMHQGALGQVPVSCFVVCGTLLKDTEENRQKAAGYLEPVRELVQPVDEGLFAGAVNFGKMSFLYQLVIRVMGGTEGDYRNWDAIQAWTDGLPAALALVQLGANGPAVATA